MNLGANVQKEFRRIKANKKTLVLIFFIPVVLIVIFGLSTGGSATKFYNVAVISLDSQPQTTIMENGVLVNDTAEYTPLFFDVIENKSRSFGLEKSYNITSDKSYKTAIDETYKMIGSETIDLVIILPANFTECLKNSQNLTIILQLDGSDAATKNGIDTAIQEPIFLTLTEIIQSNISNIDVASNFTILMPTLEYDVPSWENVIMNFAVPIMLPIIIVGTTMNLTSLCIVSEGPLDRMLLTPMAKKEALISKFIAYGSISFAQSTEIFILTILFGLFIRGSMFDFFITLVLIGLVGMSMGLAISALSKTEQMANQFFIFFFVLVTIFSGNIVPVGVPLPLPLSHAIPLLQSISLKGVTLTNEILWLVGIIIFYSFIAYLAYSRKKVEV
jgi:ABC-2 family transporter protein